MNRRKGFGLLFAIAMVAVSLTGCESGREMLHYMQPYQWGKLNRGVGGFGADGYSQISPSSAIYFASVTDDEAETGSAIAIEPSPE